MRALNEGENSIRHEILRQMGAQDYEPQTLVALLRTLGAQGVPREGAKKAIEALIESSQIAWVYKNKLCLAADAGLFTGTLKVKKNGWGLLVVEPQPYGFCPEILTIEPKNVGCALSGDRIEAQLYTPHHSSARPDEHYARPTKILKCGHSELIGTFAEGRYFVCDDPHIPVRAKIQAPKNVSVGDTIVVSVSYTLKSQTLAFKEKLGDSRDPATELQALLKRYGLEDSFPPEVETQVKKLPKRVTQHSCEGRTDLRDLFTLTIDPDDAKDFDDALTLEPLSLGRVRVGVHIADVSHYIKAGSPLDIEARKRGNSTYLGPTVVPMLPFELSNELCSLKPRVDRLTKSVLLTLSRSGKVLKTEFANSVIRSDKRLTYSDAYALLQEKPSKAEEPEAQVLRTLWNYASKLRQARMKAGSLDIDIPEVRVHFDEKGYPSALVASENDESHQLVEEFMLAANEAVAKALREKALPTVYRVHEAPQPAKLSELEVFLKEHGIKSKVPFSQNPQALAQVLVKIKKHPQAYILKIKVLRSLRQACYDALALGHYGLGKRDYLHFTSPIRRYADLVAHRSLECLMGLSRSFPIGLKEIAEHISKTEQNSTEAERDFQKRKRMLFYAHALKTRPKDLYTAIIVDAKSQGLFVELPKTLSFGFVPSNTLGPDTYQLTRDNKALVGSKHGRCFAVGQTITVQLLSVDVQKQEIDFRLARDGV